MFVYLSAFIFTLFFAYLYSKVHNKRIKKFMFLLVIFPFWFISAFRYDVGTDYFNTYVKYYEHTKLGWKPYRTEPLFQLLNNVLVRLNCNVVWLFIITSFRFRAILKAFLYRIIRVSLGFLLLYLMAEMKQKAFIAHIFTHMYLMNQTVIKHLIIFWLARLCLNLHMRRAVNFIVSLNLQHMSIGMFQESRFPALFRLK